MAQSLSSAKISAPIVCVAAGAIFFSQVGARALTFSEILGLSARAALASDFRPLAIEDPTPVLETLARDPVARAIEAEASAVRLRRGKPLTTPVPASPGSSGADALDPLIAHKLRSAFNVLGGPGPVQGAVSYRPFDFRAAAAKSRPRAPSKPRARRLSGPSPEVASAIALASRSTGTDHAYLWTAAARESGFDPSADAKTTTAYGLFQFLEQTWFATVKRHGPRHGLNQVADRITRNRDGSYDVQDYRTRLYILGLRGDPNTAAVMAGEFTADNRQRLEAAWRRPPRHGELYMAHFLGAEGALTLASVARSSPYTSAASIFPAAARKNPAMFYVQGRPVTAYELMQRLIYKGEHA